MTKTLEYMPLTCKTVEEIFRYLYDDIQDIPLSNEFDKKDFDKKVFKLIMDASTDLKRDVTYPFREALESLYSDYGSEVSKLQDKIDDKDSIIEDLQGQIESLKETLDNYKDNC